jgi:LmbE family N-acetylglucosaminyl deacetylase
MKQFILNILVLLFSIIALPFFLATGTADHNGVNSYKDQGYLALYQAITDLESNFTLMSIAAHPDDEDIETLTYYRRKKGVKTVVVAATRGEGGQNEIGSELYRDLGVIRTYEMWHAGAISGSEYYNLNLEEFGYSKTAEETFEKWGHEEPLRRLVKLIRNLRPDVIITNHDTQSGHGNHQAVGILIREAFDIAGDSTKFREQIKQGLSVWQPKRLFQRFWKSENNKNPSLVKKLKRLFKRLGKTQGSIVSVPVGDYDEIRGESYAQMAARALSEHRSQGMELFAKRIKRGPRFTYYKMIDSIDGQEPTGDDLFAALPDIFEKIQTNSVNYSLDNINQLRMVRQQTISKFYEDPAQLKRALVKELVLWRRLHADLGKSSPLSQRVEEQISKLEKAIFYALGLDFNVHLSDEKVIRGQEVQIKTILFNGGKDEVILKSVKLMPKPAWFGENIIFSKTPDTKLSYNQSDTTVFSFEIPESAKFTVPKTEIYYQSDHWVPLLTGLIEYEYGGVRLHAGTEADFDVVPELELKLIPSKTMVPLSLREYNRYFIVQIVNNIPDSLAGQVRLEWESSPTAKHDFSLTRLFSVAGESEETAIRFEVGIPGNYEAGNYKLRVSAHFSNDLANRNQVQTEGLVSLMDVSTIPGLKVGLVESYDNTLQNALNQLGIENELLAAEDLQWGDLSQFDTIILDIRVYSVRQDLRKNNARILEYVKTGGNLVVMYQKVFEWNAEYGNPPWAPFPLILSRQRVSYEDAPIEILARQHPLFNVPNKITSADWDGWVQERGLYFPSKWAANFKPLLSMSDPGEPPLTGSYLVADFGKGTYIYTSLVWYRQLRALVPGAYRNLVNMVSYARTKLPR